MNGLEPGAALRVGTEVTCAACETKLATVDRLPKYGELVAVDQFTLYGPPKLAGERLKCYACGSHEVKVFVPSRPVVH